MAEPRIAYYLRLSLADGDLGKDKKEESNSIENQRKLLDKYRADKGIVDGTVTEYVDDGYTGTNFKRPGFQQMIEDAKKGTIKTIMVKDLSRLGRDYIEVGDYVEQIFPILGIRFIAVNDNLDSASADSTMALEQTISNLINTLYSRDLSKKRQSSLLTQWKHGKGSAFTAPFGYMMDKTRRGRYIIDPESSIYVRMIFNYALRGLKPAEIALKMNELRIPTPAKYEKSKMRKEIKSVVAPDSELLWGYNSIRNILKKEEYTGTLILGKRRTIQVGSNRTKKVPKSEWYYIRDTHEPIVSREEFEAAQMVIKKVKPIEYLGENHYALKGKARCGVCKRMLAYSARSYEDIFFCQYKATGGKVSGCSEERYDVKKIDATVKYAIRNMLHLAEHLQMKLGEQEEARKEKRTMNEMNAAIDKLKAERIRKYELYVDGHIRRDEYIRAKNELTQQIEEMETKRDSFQKEGEEIKNLKGQLRKVTILSMAFSDEEELTKMEVDAFIDCVYIYDSTRIEVVFLAEDVLQKAVEQCGLAVKVDTDLVW